MSTLEFSALELAQLAAALGNELKRLEAEVPEDFNDPDSYAFAIKALHRRIITVVPAP